MKIAVISLGCPKNQCDADVLCSTFIKAGHVMVSDIMEADVAIVNTCGFIESAKQEAIDCILMACGYKEQNKKLKVVVTGCLAQRYGQEVMNEIPECDAVVGIGANPDILQVLESVQSGEKVVVLPDKENLPISGERIISTPKHYAYLKIAEGCSNCCHYCAIPLIRGPLRSREMEDVLQEGRWLAQQGVKELIVVAQDITAYGEDLTGKRLLPALLKALEKIEGIHWIRLLYAYPERITDELIDVMVNSEKIVPYIDIPIQHINSQVLQRMNRKGGRDTVIRAIDRLRKDVPAICIRTTLITGFPGETEEQFYELYNFVKEYKIERLGCFAFSEEEGTVAAGMEDQLPVEEREKRAEQIMLLQAGIMAGKQAALVGTVQEVICDGYDEDTEKWVCRTRFDAPEIDGVCYVEADIGMAEQKEFVSGAFYQVEITGSDVYDLFAKRV